MKMLKLLVYYMQNLQNTKFYSRKIKFGLQCVCKIINMNYENSITKK